MKRLILPLSALSALILVGGVGSFFILPSSDNEESGAAPEVIETPVGPNPQWIADGEQPDDSQVHSNVAKLPAPEGHVVRGNDDTATQPKTLKADAKARPIANPLRQTSSDPFGARRTDGGDVRQVAYQEQDEEESSEPSPGAETDAGDAAAASTAASPLQPPTALPVDDQTAGAAPPKPDAEAATDASRYDLGSRYGAAPPSNSATPSRYSATEDAQQSPASAAPLSRFETSDTTQLEGPDVASPPPSPGAAPPTSPPDSDVASEAAPSPEAPAPQTESAAGSRFSPASSPDAGNPLRTPKSLGESVPQTAAAIPGTPAPMKLENMADAALLPASAQPGAKGLEGQQTPALLIEKTAPPEIQVGRTAVFQIKVRNVGQAAAHQVVVSDRVPQGTEFAEASPKPSLGEDGSLQWSLGTIESGEEQVINLSLTPVEEGEIGSVATVAFAAKASVRTICTRPLLTLEQITESKVLIGDDLILNIKVTNPGTGAATNVVIQENVPEYFSHPAGDELEYEIGTLRPGETRQVKLAIKAAKPGLVENVLSVRGDGIKPVERRAAVEVISPEMDLVVQGPKKRYLARQASYTLTLANPGTAPATNLQMTARLPKGMKFVSANNAGQYDTRSHAVYWSLEELLSGQQGDVELKLMPIEFGEQKLRIEGNGDLGLKSAVEQVVVVEGLAELAFTVSDSADPVEVSGATVYEVKVVNKGSKTATGVRLSAEAPAGMKLIEGGGAAQATVRGQQMVFGPLSRLNPDEEAVYRIQAQGLKPGDHRIRISLASDESPDPVTKEESTRVYADQ